MIIPNIINGVVLIGGLAESAANRTESVFLGVAFAISVFSSLWVIRYVHQRLTGRVGLGLGDVKLASAASCWFSPSLFPFFLFVASGLGLIFVVFSSLVMGKSINQRFPFGPFLAVSLIITWSTELLLGPFFG